MPKGIGYPAKNLNAKRVGAGQTKIRSVVTVGKLNSSPLRPSPKYNTPAKFGGYFKKGK